MTHCERLLEVLSDRQEHPHTELYRLGMMVHSRVADLRKRGYNVVHNVRRVDGRNVSFYRLDGPLPAPPSPNDWGRTAGGAGSVSPERSTERAPVLSPGGSSESDPERERYASRGAGGIQPPRLADRACEPVSGSEQLTLGLPPSAFRPAEAA